MGFLVRVGLLAGAGALVYKMLRKDKDKVEGTEAAGEPVFSSGVVRNAGETEQQDSQGDWDKVDEASDASFPASDPPAVP